mmetsp:Transcript_19919/g.46763  ORF Transcript_19919/g.46763 Transcript_19919/m.46763 type:complete len:263 (-) Transcript_19919:316-1104(-)
MRRDGGLHHRAAGGQRVPPGRDRSLAARFAVRRQEDARVEHACPRRGRRRGRPQRLPAGARPPDARHEGAAGRRGLRRGLAGDPEDPGGERRQGRGRAGQQAPGDPRQVAEESLRRRRLPPTLRPGSGERDHPGQPGRGRRGTRDLQDQEPPVRHRSRHHHPPHRRPDPDPPESAAALERDGNDRDDDDDGVDTTTTTTTTTASIAAISRCEHRNEHRNRTGTPLRTATATTENTASRKQNGRRPASSDSVYLINMKKLFSS